MSLQDSIEKLAAEQERLRYSLDQGKATGDLREDVYGWTATSSAYACIPGVRGAWNMASLNETGAVYDITGQGRALTNNHVCTFSYTGFAPYVLLDGTNDYLSRADEAGLDILGSETYVVSTERGLTFGGWFYPTQAAGTTEALIGKWQGAANYSYLLYRDSTEVYSCALSLTGAAALVFNSTLVPTINAWQFVVGRYSPSGLSNEVSVWKNDTEWMTQVGVPASLFNGTAAFEIGANAPTNTNPLQGRASFCFLSAMYLSDDQIKELFYLSAPAFGVAL